jgi:hypothetical protein
MPNRRCQSPCVISGAAMSAYRELRAARARAAADEEAPLFIG